MDTQKLIDIMFEIGLTINQKRRWFEDMTNEEVAEWIAKQLKDNGFDTTPVGMSWGILKEK